MPATRISRAHCQREIVTSLARLRVMSLAPATITTISTQVVTIVAFSLTKPCCQRISWSLLRRMLVFKRPARESSDGHAGEEKSEQAQRERLPARRSDHVKAGEDKAHAQQHATCEPQGGVCSRERAPNGPPQAAETDHAEES